MSMLKKDFGKSRRSFPDRLATLDLEVYGLMPNSLLVNTKFLAYDRNILLDPQNAMADTSRGEEIAVSKEANVMVMLDFSKQAAKIVMNEMTSMMRVAGKSEFGLYQNSPEDISFFENTLEQFKKKIAEKIKDATRLKVGMIEDIQTIHANRIPNIIIRARNELPYKEPGQRESICPTWPHHAGL